LAIQTVIKSGGNDSEVKFPNVKTTAGLIAEAEKVLRAKGDSLIPADYWAAAYVPDFERFDRGEYRRKPIEWNQTLAGKTHRVGSSTPPGPWLVRYRDAGGAEGFFLDSADGSIRRTQDSRRLGY
jgi:hypothetical protein